MICSCKSGPPAAGLGTNARRYWCEEVLNTHKAKATSAKTKVLQLSETFTGNKGIVRSFTKRVITEA